MAGAVPCKICGRVAVPKYARAICCDVCFTTDFWQEKIRWKNAGDKALREICARIQGCHYIIGWEGQEPWLMRGFGGRKFRIRFVAGPHEGKVVDSTNLWTQGKIPDRFRAELPDNAVFEEVERRPLDSVTESLGYLQWPPKQEEEEVTND